MPRKTCEQLVEIHGNKKTAQADREDNARCWPGSSTSSGGLSPPAGPALLTLVTEIRDERTRRQKVARVRAQIYTAENNVHRIAQQAQTEILRLLRDRRESSDGADQGSQ